MPAISRNGMAGSDFPRFRTVISISTILHKKITSEILWNNLKRLLNDKNFENLSEEDKAVIKHLEKDIIKSRKIPNEYVQRFSKLTSIAYNVWQ